MRDKRFLGVLLLMLPIFLSAQNVSIVGKTNKTNALVRLLTYNDMFTIEQKTIAETYSNYNGKFVLSVDIKEVTPAQIAINLDRVDVVLSPEGKYDIEIFVPEKKYNVSIFEKEKPSLKINSADDNGLMKQLVDSELLINDFIYENVNAIYQGRKTYLIDTLQNRIEKTVGEKPNEYVNGFVRYKLAAVRMPVVAGGSKKIITQYFDNQPVMYLQNAYMELFNEAFDGYFNNREFNQQEFVNELFSGYEKFTDYLKKNDFLKRNPQLSELILMKYLYQIYYENQGKRAVANDYLNKIKDTSKYLKNKEIASDLLLKVKRLSYDTEAPSFSLKDKDGIAKQLSDYQDDMLLLQFVDHVTEMTSHQFEVLNDLQRQWSDTITVVTIATNDSFGDFEKLFAQKCYNWQLLNLGDDILLWEKYNVRTCPEYLIIKRKGRIGMAPAPAPDNYLDYHVRRISNYK